MRKYAITTVLFVCLALFIGSPAKAPDGPAVFSPAIVQNVLDHSLAVVSYFAVPKATVDRILKKLNEVGITSRQTSPNWPYVVPMDLQAEEVVVAIIGSATLVKGGYAVSVAHMFQLEDDQGAPLRRLKSWVLQRNTDHPVEVAVVAFTDLKAEPFWNDYAVVKLSEDLGLPGIKIAEQGGLQGSPAMMSGTVSGSAFFARFGFLTEFRRFLRKGTDGVLHLTAWVDFPFTCVYPGGGGDSGGGIFNSAGELIGVMYCGVQIASEQYVFSNPLTMLKEYLVKVGLKELL